MQNIVPASGSGVRSVERDLAERAFASRVDAYAEEARRLIDAALAVMRRSGSIDPQVRDVVREAGLSNQAFYRHFPSKDALLLAVLADGQQRLVSYLAHRLSRIADPHERVRGWIEGVMEQARNPQAAEATRPFAINEARLLDRFPDEVAASRSQLVDTLRDAVRDAGGDDRDAELVHDLAMTCMHDAIALRRVPDRAEIARLVRFCLGGIANRGGA